MNPFQTYLQPEVTPSLENDQGPMTTEVEQKVEQDLNANVTDEAITDDVAEEATKLLNEQEVAMDNAVKTAETVTESIASLEALYETLTIVSQERDTLTEGEAGLMRIALAGIAKPMGGQVADLVPSLESDNVFERNDVTVSMESIGAAISAGVKTAIKVIIDLAKKIVEWFKNIGVRITNKAKLLRAKLRDWTASLEVDFPNQYFKSGMSFEDMHKGWVASDEAIAELTKLDIAQMTRRRRSADPIDMDAILNPFVSKIANAAKPMSRMGYDFEYVQRGEYKITQNFEPKAGATTIVIPKSMFRAIDVALGDWIARQAALANFINTNEQIATELEAKDDNSVSKTDVAMVKSGLTLSRTICQINAYIVTAIHVAFTRKDRGELSESAKQKSVSSRVANGGADARIVNQATTREVAVR